MNINVIGLCDRALNSTASRQYVFDFLLGDKRGDEIRGDMRGTRGKKLPVDAFYSDHNLVIEYWERQHTEPVPIMDKRLTCSGCDRRQQRSRYDQLKKLVLGEHGIRLMVLEYTMFECDGRKRLRRVLVKDEAVIRERLHDFIGNSSESH